MAIVDLPGEVGGTAIKDVSDLLDAGGTREQLQQLVEDATEWKPAVASNGNGHHAGPWAGIRTAAKLLAEEETEVSFLDADGDRLAVPGAITFVASPRGLGKTHKAHHLAVVEAGKGRRVLLIDRDNSRREVRRRLRNWGADGCENLHVISREDAPPLTDVGAWKVFPHGYDLIVVDSLDSSTEGCGEQDSSKPSKALAGLLDVARRTSGPAIIMLGNAIKAGHYARGSGVIEDRCDIVFEVRDATGFTPSGKRAWWEELPPAGREQWAGRATRRKRRDSYRLAFIASKFRVGEEPDPFVVEVDLSTTPWSCRNLTHELIATGEEAATRQAEVLQKALDAAADALAEEISDRPGELNIHDAVAHLREHGLTNKQARALRKSLDGQRWFTRPHPGQGGGVRHWSTPEGTRRPTSPPDSTEEAGGHGKSEAASHFSTSSNPCKTSLFDMPKWDAHAPHGRPTSTLVEPDCDKGETKSRSRTPVLTFQGVGVENDDKNGGEKSDVAFPPDSAADFEELP